MINDRNNDNYTSSGSPQLGHLKDLDLALPQSSVYNSPIVRLRGLVDYLLLHD